MTKFDVVIGNPPYKQGLHLKFLNLAVDMSNKYVIFVQPGSIYVNKQPTRKSKEMIKAKEKIKNHIIEIDLFESWRYFPDLGIIVPMAVTFLDKSKTSDSFILYDKVKNKKYKYNEMDNIHLHGNSKEFLKLYKIFNNFKDTLLNHRNKNVGPYYVNIPMIRGDLEKGKYYADKWFSFFKESTIVEKTKSNLFFSFKTEEEAENFLNFLKTKFAMFGLSLYKISFHQEGWELLGIPWLDFSQKWTNEKLYKHFKLAPNEINFIEENIPTYY